MGLISVEEASLVYGLVSKREGEREGIFNLLSVFYHENFIFCSYYYYQGACSVLKKEKEKEKEKRREKILSYNTYQIFAPIFCCRFVYNAVKF